MWRNATLWFGLALLGMVAACSEDPAAKDQDVTDQETTPPVEYPPDKEEVGPFTLKEADVTAARTPDGFLVSLKIGNAGDVAASGSLAIELQRIGEKQLVLASAGKKLDLPKGSLDAVVPLAWSEQEGKWDIPVGDEPFYIITWSLETKEGTLKGTRGLPVMLAHRDVALILPSSAVPGEPLPVRVSVSRVGDWAPMAGEEVRVNIHGKDLQKTVTVVTDQRGLARAEVTPDSEGTVSVSASSTSGDSGLVTSNALVERQSRILLTTDKPIYQPGQLVHIRILALDRFSRAPLANQSVLLEGFDGEVNRIYKVSLTTDEFGVASSTMQIASQVLLGSWRLRATIGEDFTEKTIKVDRYALPRFKLTTQKDKPWYKPGQTMELQVGAQYFFGKPVAGGEIKLDMYVYLGQWQVYSSHQAQTNPEGIASLELALPDYLVAAPVDGSEEGDETANQTSVLLQLEVTDTAGHKEKQTVSVPVVESEFSLTVIPESGSMVQGVENRLYVFLTDPAGNSISGPVELTYSPAGDYSGPKLVEIPPAAPLVVTLRPGLVDGSGCGKLNLSKKAQDGSVAFTAQRSVCAESTSSLLLRTDRALYQVGDEAVVDVYAGEGIGDGFLDVVRAGQTVLTKTIELNQGRGSMILDLDNSLTGELELHVYRLREDGFMARDSRLIAVLNNNELAVETKLDKSTYRPGETATVEFTVKDQNQVPTVAALGIQVVDEAVFALAESQPGLARLYFLLEEALLQAKASFAPGKASFGELTAQTSDNPADSAEAQSAQQIALALLATQGDQAAGSNVESTWANTRVELQESYTRLASEMRYTITDQIAAELKKLGYSCDSQAVTAQVMAELVIVDPWGNRLQALEGQNGQYLYVTLTSWGIDELAGTDDDMQFEFWPNWFKDWMGCYRETSDTSVAIDASVAWDSGSWGWQDNVAPSEDVMEGDSHSGGQGPGGVKVRQWFPETLFVAPSVITDAQGKASVEIPIADSITQWRMSTMASTTQGLLGSKTDGFVVFQEFFIDIDLPKYLVRNDEITFPVLVYNYLEVPQTVEIQLEPGDWFELDGASTASLVLQPGEVTAVSFPVKVTQVGWHNVTVTGMGTAMSDAVMRTVQVKPDGTEVASTQSGRLGGAQTEPHLVSEVVSVTFPSDAILGSPVAVVRASGATPSAAMTQGLDGMLQMPTGCFEQTTASAWPNVLILKYLKATQQTSPEIEMKAVQFIQAGYQRILTFEVPGGGFNWWETDSTGNTILSAIAIQMLTDTKEVHDAVEQAVIERTYAYLASNINVDGSWAAEPNLHAGNEALGQSGLRTTCYIAWSLGYGGYKSSSPAASAASYIETYVKTEEDIYTLAICANALAWLKPGSSVLPDLLSDLAQQALVEGDKAHWATAGDTWCGSNGNTADVELTGAITLALAAAQSRPDLVTMAGNWLVDSRDPQGSWGYNTQATVMALKALLVAGDSGGNPSGTLEVLLNGVSVAARQFTEFNKDVVWQVELGELLDPLENQVELAFQGSGSLQWQVAWQHHMPWELQPVETGPLTVSVTLDSTAVQVDDIVTVTVYVTNSDPFQEGKNAMVIVGIPAGFAVVTQDLAQLRTDGVIQAFEVTGREVLFYIESLPVDQTLTLTYGLLATMPVKSSGAEAEVYMYYDKETGAEAPPSQFEAM